MPEMLQVGVPTGAANISQMLRLKSVLRGCRIVDGHGCSGREDRISLHLDPVRVTGRRQILVQQRLSRAHRPRNGVIVVVPTPITHELLAVLTSDAVGAPEAALLLPTAPIAPDPFVPDVFTPAKLMTCIDETTLCDKLAATVTPLKGTPAKARQISADPLCPFVLWTSVHVNPPPETFVTVVFVPLI